MIEQTYGEVRLPQALLQRLEKLLSRYVIPKQASRLAVNYRALDYYQTKQGIHPVEIQLKKNGDTWQVIFIASFSYPSEHHTSVDIDLSFHLANGWCYQPDAGGRCDLHQPTIKDLFNCWIRAFLQHLKHQSFDDISVTIPR